MTIDRLQHPLRILLVAIALVTLAACSGGAVSGSPGSSPVASAGGPVTSRVQAVERVVQSEPRLTGIGQRDPNMIGQSSWYEVTPASGVAGFIVTVRVGWGDCQAGCISEHTWVYGVGPDGTVRLESEAGDTVPAEAWPSPGAGGSGGGGQEAPGIRITALAGPTCPVERVPPDPACAPRPVLGTTIVVQDAQGNEIAKALTDASGVAFIAVKPGLYVVRGVDTGTLPTAPEPQQAEVAAGQVAEVTLSYDTGIR
jgi:hypothetical protein